MNKRTRLTLALFLAALCALAVGAAGSDEPDRSGIDRLSKRLLKASEGVQYPGSESDSTWAFVSYPDEEELPDAARFEEVSGCPVTAEGGTGRFGFDATFERLTRIEDWMDDGQVKSARGFRKIERIMRRSYGDRAVYRCETGEYGQVYIYFVGLNQDGVSGLLTVSTET